MEDVLSVYSRPYDEKKPVVCMDEKPVQFFADFRKGFRSRKNGVQYEDYQYIRNGTACIFLFTEPLAGWRYANAQERRTREDWARQIDWLLTKQYPDADKPPSRFRNHFNFNQPVFGKSRHLNGGAGRAVLFEKFGIHRVHGRKILHIF